jgi:hypothetical protein
LRCIRVFLSLRFTAYGMVSAGRRGTAHFLSGESCDSLG